jgi:hypothetical protein
VRVRGVLAREDRPADEGVAAMTEQHKYVDADAEKLTEGEYVQHVAHTDHPHHPHHPAPGEPGTAPDTPGGAPAAEHQE